MAIKKAPVVLNSIAERVKKAKEEWVPMSSIKLWPENQRKHDKENILRLAAVLKQFGQVSPVIVYTEDGVVRKGNGTCLALQHNNERMVLIRRVDFGSKAAADAYGLADNKSPEWSEWDNEALIKYFNSDVYKENNFETGFTEKEVLMFNLSEQLPGALPEIDLEGTISGKTKFIIVVFDKEDENQMDDLFKNLDLRHNQKTINWKQLKRYTSGTDIKDEVEEL